MELQMFYHIRCGEMHTMIYKKWIVILVFCIVVVLVIGVYIVNIPINNVKKYVCENYDDLRAIASKTENILINKGKYGLYMGVDNKLKYIENYGNFSDVEINDLSTGEYDLLSSFFIGNPVNKISYSYPSAILDANKKKIEMEIKKKKQDTIYSVLFYDVDNPECLANPMENISPEIVYKKHISLDGRNVVYYHYDPFIQFKSEFRYVKDGVWICERKMHFTLLYNLFYE